MSIINPLVHAFACGDKKLGLALLNMGADPNLPCPTLNVSLTRYLWNKYDYDTLDTVLKIGGKLDNQDLFTLFNQYRYADDKQIPKLLELLTKYQPHFELGIEEMDSSDKHDDPRRFWHGVHKLFDDQIRHYFYRDYSTFEEDKKMLDILFSPPFSQFCLAELSPYPNAYIKENTYPFMTPFAKLMISFFNQALYNEGLSFIPHTTPQGDVQLRLSRSNDYYYDNHFKSQILLKHCLSKPGFAEVFEKAIAGDRVSYKEKEGFLEYYEKTKLEMVATQVKVHKKPKKAL